MQLFCKRAYENKFQISWLNIATNYNVLSLQNDVNIYKLYDKSSRHEVFWIYNDKIKFCTKYGEIYFCALLLIISKFRYFI